MLQVISDPHISLLLCLCTVLFHRENETRVDKTCPCSLCNYLPIFLPSVAFIIPFRSHLGVGDCHRVAPPSLKVCRMKCRSPPIDLYLPAFLFSFLFPCNKRHLEIRINDKSTFFTAVYAVGGEEIGDRSSFKLDSKKHFSNLCFKLYQPPKLSC